MLPGIRPAVLGTLSIELVVVVCAVRVEMACGPGARQPPSSAWVILRGASLGQFPRRGLEYRGATRGCRGVPACGMRARALNFRGSERGLFNSRGVTWMGSEFTGLFFHNDGL